MTRAILSLLLSGLCLAVGLYTAQVQSQNYAKGAQLDRIKRRCDLLEASSERLQYDINARLRRMERELPRQVLRRGTEDAQ